MSTFIYVIVASKAGTGSRLWYWNEFEAGSKFADLKDEVGDSYDINLFRLNLDPHIDDLLDSADLLDLGAELRKSHTVPVAPPAVTFSPLTASGDIERNEGSDSWRYTVSHRFKGTWHVRNSYGVLLGSVHLTDEASVIPHYGVEDDGGLWLKVTPSLQEAVEFVIERNRDNG